MSVVHGYLKRNERGKRAASAAEACPPAPVVEPLATESRETFESAVRRKETLLKEGIRILEQRIGDLSARLTAVQQELEDARAENMRLRQGAMRDALTPRAQPHAREPSLLSKALE